MKPVAIFWFRRDLRLDDNHGLFHALKSGHPVLPVFIFDKKILDPLTDKKDKRVSFIYQQLQNLNQKLAGYGSSLLVMHDAPLHAFEVIASVHDVKAIFTNHDYEPYAAKRDKQIADFWKAKNVLFHDFKDQVIFERFEILKDDGSPYHVFTPYCRKWKKAFLEQKPAHYHSERLCDHFIKTKPFPFPLLEQTGFEFADPGVLAPRLDRSLIKNYHETRNIPSIKGTTRLGVHLRFGTISIRKAVQAAIEHNEQWLNELVWREFFMMILFHYPDVVSESFKKKFDKIKWRNNEREFALWCRGETGYPIVDAGMRELNETGFMHNRVRMIAASFLTKHLLIDWRWGEAYFAEKLLDYELSSNNGNWQWVAGSGCDAAPYFRIFNPTVQTKKFDPQLSYIKKWIKDFDTYHLSPIVDHDFARKRAITIYQAAVGQR